MSESSPSDNSKVSAENLPDLEFPIAPDFYSAPPKMNLYEYHEWCLSMRKHFKDDPAERLAQKCTVEFVIKD